MRNTNNQNIDRLKRTKPTICDNTFFLIFVISIAANRKPAIAQSFLRTSRKCPKLHPCICGVIKAYDN